MVRNYSEAISSGNSTIFVRLLAMWKGSLYKLVWCDVLIYIVLYYIINFTYRFALSADDRVIFEKVIQFCEDMRKNIPISFILGFLVAGVIGRWWLLYEAIPYPDSVAFFIQSFTEGHGNPRFEENDGDSEGKGKKTEVKDPKNYDPFFSDNTRFHLLRYVMLSWTLLMLHVSEQISTRFNVDMSLFKKPGRAVPLNRSCTEISSAENLVQMEEEHEIEKFCKNLNADPEVQETFGILMTDAEMRVFQDMCRNHRYLHGKSCGLEYWVPLQWASRLVQKAGIQGYFCDARLIATICNKINRMREQMLTFYHQSELIIPLVYTQVVVIVVYTYFLAQLLASQQAPSSRLAQHRNEVSNYTLFNSTFSTSADLSSNTSHLMTTEKTKDDKTEVDMIIPLFDILVFLFLMGWLKVAMCVLNPFGSDDEDFEISGMFVSNLHRCYESAISHRCFPDSLPRATMSYYQVSSAKEDNLQEFLQVNHKYWLDRNIARQNATNSLDYTTLRRRSTSRGFFSRLQSFLRK